MSLISSVPSTSAESTVPSRRMTLTRLDANYQSSVYTNATNDFTNLIDSYTLTNARLSWMGQEDVWEAALEVTNLTDELYYLTIFDQRTSVGQVTGQPGFPRMYGLTLKRRF